MLHSKYKENSPIRAHNDIQVSKGTNSNSHASNQPAFISKYTHCNSIYARLGVNVVFDTGFPLLSYGLWVGGFMDLGITTVHVPEVATAKIIITFADIMVSDMDTTGKQKMLIPDLILKGL